MKKIHFDELNFKNSKLHFALILTSIIFLLLYVFKPFEFISEKNYGILFSLVFVIQLFTNSKVFWYKYFVQWNKKGIIIKINDFWGKNLKFNEISNFDLKQNRLTIIKLDGKKEVFNLENIEQESVNKLMNILKTKK
ncbi:hypothetical protein [Daejeonia sp. YH14]|uniref:hypothetical protein n=1 Tax=Daejeonia sp. YH14 TaxID=3439042 RepID=UPI003F49ACBE